MFPFECIGPDGRTYFHFDNWGRFLAQRQQEYPPTIDHRRYELTLIYPRLRLEEVFTPIGPVTHHDIHFHSNEWSTIFDVYPAHCFTADGDNSVKIIVEEGHVNPWGAPVTIMSDDVAPFDNNNRNFVYFQGKYWKILNSVNLTHPDYYRPIAQELVQLPSRILLGQVWSPIASRN